jgi:hypothetical protein
MEESEMRGELDSGGGRTEVQTMDDPLHWTY